MRNRDPGPRFFDLQTSAVYGLYFTEVTCSECLVFCRVSGADWSEAFFFILVDLSLWFLYEDQKCFSCQRTYSNRPGSLTMNFWEKMELSRLLISSSFGRPESTYLNTWIMRPLYRLLSKMLVLMKVAHLKKKKNDDFSDSWRFYIRWHTRKKKFFQWIESHSECWKFVTKYLKFSFVARSGFQVTYSSKIRDFFFI